MNLRTVFSLKALNIQVSDLEHHLRSLPYDFSQMAFLH